MSKIRLLIFVIVYNVFIPIKSNAQRIFKDFNPGEGFSNAYIIGSTDTSVIFSADDGEHGYELWYLSLDGVSKPYMIKDLTTGQNNTYYNQGGFFDGKDWWITKIEYSGSNNTYSLIITDGTEAGTRELDTFKQSNINFQNGQCVVFKDKFYFSAYDSTGTNIWVSDKTPEGTKKFIDIDPTYSFNSQIYKFSVMGDKMYFIAYVPKYGYELWSSDGTVEGTKMIIDNYPGNMSGIYGADYFVNKKTNKIYFAGQVNNEIGLELYETDGTAAGTKLFKDFDPRSNLSSNPRIFPLNDTSFFVCTNVDNDFYISISDGTLAGTHQLEVNTALKNIYMIQEVFKQNETYYLLAYSIDFGSEIWTFNPPYNQLNLVMDVQPGPTNGVNSSLIWMGNIAYFYGTNVQMGNGIWRTDGTFENTRPYLTIGDSWYITSLLKYKDKILILGLLDYSYGQELYILDNLRDLNQMNLESLTLYPNPVHHGQTISISNLPDQYELELRDLYGKTIWKGNDINTCKMQDTWANGIYYLSVQSGSSHYTLKIILN